MGDKFDLDPMQGRNLLFFSAFQVSLLKCIYHNQIHVFLFVPIKFPMCSLRRSQYYLIFLSHMHGSTSMYKL
jgi:hypothetical protein